MVTDNREVYIVYRYFSMYTDYRTGIDHSNTLVYMRVTVDDLNTWISPIMYIDDKRHCIYFDGLYSRDEFYNLYDDLFCIYNNPLFGIYGRYSRDMFDNFSEYNSSITLLIRHMYPSLISDFNDNKIEFIKSLQSEYINEIKVSLIYNVFYTHSSPFIIFNDKVCTVYHIYEKHKARIDISLLNLDDIHTFQFRQLFINSESYPIILSLDKIYYTTDLHSEDFSDIDKSFLEDLRTHLEGSEEISPHKTVYYSPSNNEIIPFDEFIDKGTTAISEFREYEDNNIRDRYPIISEGLEIYAMSKRRCMIFFRVFNFIDGIWHDSGKYTSFKVSIADINKYLRPFMLYTKSNDILLIFELITYFDDLISINITSTYRHDCFKYCKYTNLNNKVLIDIDKNIINNTEFKTSIYKKYADELYRTNTSSYIDFDEDGRCSLKEFKRKMYHVVQVMNGNWSRFGENILFIACHIDEAGKLIGTDDRPKYTKEELLKRAKRR